MIKLALLSSIIPVVLVTAAWGLDKIVKRQETVSILVNYFNQVWSRGEGSGGHIIDCNWLGKR